MNIEVQLAAMAENKIDKDVAGNLICGSDHERDQSNIS